jgi:serine/threonine-protein kinase
MGAVYLAEHTGLGAAVAVKLLNESCITDPTAMARFRREALAMGAVRHDNVVAVMDTGTDEDGAPFIVMEHLEGESLSAMLRRDRVLPLVFAYRIAAQILLGLGAAHAKNVVHRDLKPGNVFMARQPDGTVRAKILDFGVSKLADSSATLNVTADGVAIGTPSFMAPEQIRGQPDLDVRIDVYSVGVLLYRMLTGTLPFRAASSDQLNRQILTGEPVPPRELRPDIPQELEDVILRAMHRDRRQRYPETESFRAALQAAMAGPLAEEIQRGNSFDPMIGRPGEGSFASVVTPGISVDTAAATVAASPGALRGAPVPHPPRRRRRRWLLGIGLGVWLLFAAGVAAFLGISSSGPSGPPLRLGVTRFLADEEVRARFAGLLPYLSERLERPVELVIAADSRGLIELLDEGEIHIAALSSAAYVRATRERDDLRILATPLARGGSKGYGGAILVRARSEIRSLDDLRGRPFCYVKRDSTSGWLLPRAELREAGLDPDRDLRGVHYGNQHEETLKLLHREECDAAAVFTNIWHEAGKHGMSPDAFRAIANYHMPHDAYVVTKAMSEKEAEAIRAALLSLEPGSDVAERVLRPHDTGGFAAATDADYERIRRAVERERLAR